MLWQVCYSLLTVRLRVFLCYKLFLANCLFHWENKWPKNQLHWPWCRTSHKTELQRHLSDHTWYIVWTASKQHVHLTMLMNSQHQAVVASTTTKTLAYTPRWKKVYLTQSYRFGYLCVNYYQNWWKSDKVVTRTILLSFLGHGVAEARWLVI